MANIWPIICIFYCLAARLSGVSLLWVYTCVWVRVCGAAFKPKRVYKFLFDFGFSLPTPPPHIRSRNILLLYPISSIYCLIKNWCVFIEKWKRVIRSWLENIPLKQCCGRVSPTEDDSIVSTDSMDLVWDIWFKYLCWTTILHWAHATSFCIGLDKYKSNIRFGCDCEWSDLMDWYGNAQGVSFLEKSPLAICNTYNTYNTCMRRDMERWEWLFFFEIALCTLQQFF